MAKNNHSAGDGEQGRLDSLLRRQASCGDMAGYERALRYAESIVAVENCIAVVSRLADNSSRIIAGRFADAINLGAYDREDSTWEERILSLMSEDERRDKFISELRFFHYLRKIVPARRPDYYLCSRLRFNIGGGRTVDVGHRMYYVYDGANTGIAAAICLYGPLTFGFSAKSCVVNSVTGICEELSHSADGSVLSPRECQVLGLIDAGRKSREIAEMLNISIHTVNRHRQSILERLNVKNSHEACRIAKSMSMI